jgi:ABC-2 type transport system ATP-binding protein
VDDIGDLKSKALRSIDFHFGTHVAAEEFAPLPSVVSATGHGDSISLVVRGPLDEVIKAAAKHHVVNVETHEPSLEEIFLQAYRDGAAP